MTRHVLAIDQGTTNSKALLLDEGGRIVARAARPVEIRFPQPGWVEQDAEAIWASVEGATQDCLDLAPGGRVVALGVANQRESVVCWDARSGKSLGPVISWQCRRTSPACEDLRARGLRERLEAVTGLTIDPLFSGTKAAWLLDHIPDGRARAAAGEVRLGTVDSWLVWNLTGGGAHVTDASNASRTQLFNLDRGEWDDDLLELFGAPRAALPRVVASSGVVGETAGGLPIAGIAGDSHAAMFGHAAFGPGAVKATYGTGTSLMTLASGARAASEAGLSRTVAWRLASHDEFAIEGNIASTGGTVDWLGRLLGHSDPAQAVARLALEAQDSAGVFLVPAFAGLGAPYWDDQARGLVCGLTRGAGAAEVARAALESIALQVCDVFAAMETQAEAPLTALLADGGASGNDFLMQLQADLLDRPVLRNRSPELSATGAAWLAGLAAGVWSGLDELRALPAAVDRFEPRMAAAARRDLLDGWREAVERARLRPSLRQGQLHDAR